MRMDKLTSRFQQAIADAQSLAVGRDHTIIEPAHLLLALLDQQGGGTRPLLVQAGVNVPVLRERLAEALDKLPKVTGQAGNVQAGNDLVRLLNVTDKLAQQRGDAYIASELFLLAAIDDNGEAGKALKAAGANKQKLEAAIDKLRGGEKVTDENAEDARQALEKYTIDMTARAVRSMVYFSSAWRASSAFSSVTFSPPRSLSMAASSLALLAPAAFSALPASPASSSAASRNSSLAM